MKPKLMVTVLFLVIGGLVFGCSSKSNQEAKTEPQEVQTTTEAEEAEYFEPDPLDEAWGDALEREIEKLPDVTRAWVTPIEQGESIEIDVVLQVNTRFDIPGNQTTPILEGETGNKVVLTALKAVSDNFEDPVLYNDYKEKMDEIGRYAKASPSFGMKAQAEGEYVSCSVEIELEK